MYHFASPSVLKSMPRMTPSSSRFLLDMLVVALIQASMTCALPEGLWTFQTAVTRPLSF